jgi:transposase
VARIADVARAINDNVRTVRRLRQCYRETGWTADCPHSGRPRVTTPAQDRYIRTCETGTEWQHQHPELHQERTISPSVLRLSAIG